MLTKKSAEVHMCLSSDNHYDYLRQATIKAVGEKRFEKHFHNSKNRWVDLAKVWEIIQGPRRHYILTAVIHKIFWGVYPYEVPCDSAVADLLGMVEEVLLNDVEAHQSWSKWCVFKRVKLEVFEAMYSLGDSDIDIHFIEHYDYLKSRAECKIGLEKANPNVESSYAEEYQSYEKMVQRIIPGASIWTHEQWGDDRNIADAIKSLYGVDYICSFEKQNDFNRLINMLRSEERYGRESADFMWYAANISELPLSLAQSLWSNDLVAVVTDIFLKTYDFTKDYILEGEPFKNRKGTYIDPLYHFELAALKNSWLTSLVMKWLNTGMYSDTQYSLVRSAVFDLAMSC